MFMSLVKGILIMFQQSVNGFFEHSCTIEFLTFLNGIYNLLQENLVDGGVGWRTMMIKLLFNGSIIIVAYTPSKIKSIVDKRYELKKYNYISTCSSFDQQQTAMGRRPNSTALLLILEEGNFTCRHKLVSWLMVLQSF